MRNVSALVLVFALFSAACSKKNFELSSPFFVSWHGCTHNKFSHDYVQICFDSLLQDSRCPSGAMCIWQGEAVAKFSFTVNDTRQDITLSTLNAGTYPSDTTLMGYRVELVDILPYPQINIPRNASDYKAELRITKL